VVVLLKASVPLQVLGVLFLSNTKKDVWKSSCTVVDLCIFPLVSVSCPFCIWKDLLLCEKTFSILTSS
jgi:hypothetical protein